MTLNIPPHMNTTLENRYERLLRDKWPQAWLWMEKNSIPRLTALGRFPRTRRGWK